MRFKLVKKDGASTGTPLGELVLHRAPSKAGTAEIVAGLETWPLELDGRVVAELPGFGFGYQARALVRRGVLGTFEDAELRVHGRRHLRAGRRFVEFRTPTRTLRFEAGGFRSDTLVEDGRVLARSRDDWAAAGSDPLPLVAVALYQWAVLDSFLMNPLLELF
ncbi:hypothetical protein [Kitasatospora sp. NPDC004272]